MKYVGYIKLHNGLDRTLIENRVPVTEGRDRLTQTWTRALKLRNTGTYNPIYKRQNTNSAKFSTKKVFIKAKLKQISKLMKMKK